jgi:hypothetical protein
MPKIQFESGELWPKFITVSPAILLYIVSLLVNRPIVTGTVTGTMYATHTTFMKTLVCQQQVTL